MRNSKKLLVALAVPLMVTAGSSAAQAATIIFSNSPSSTGGIFTVGGIVQIGSTNLSPTDGVDGQIDEVAVVGGLSTAITGICDGFGCLELETGAYLGPDESTLDVNDYIYSGVNSSIRIYGTAAEVTGTDDSTLLYEGSFDPSLNIRLTFDDITCGAGPNANGTGNCAGIISGTVDGGTLNALLAQFLGVPTAVDGGSASDAFFGYRGSIFGTATTAPSGSGPNTINFIETFPIPEPGSMLLLGTGLLGFARAARRRMVRS